MDEPDELTAKTGIKMAKKKTNQTTVDLAESENPSETIYKMVEMRNNFFFAQYHHLLLAVLLSVLFLVSGLIAGGALYLKPRGKQYIPTTADYRYLPNAPLGEQFVQDGDVIANAQTTLTKLFTFNYVDFREKISEVKSRMTEQGWNSIIKQYEESKILATVSNQNLIVKIDINSAPYITKKELDQNGVFTWYVVFPNVTTSYTSVKDDSNSFKTDYAYTLAIKRVPLEFNSDGIAADVINFRNINKLQK